MGDDLADHGVFRRREVAHVRPRFFAKSMGRLRNKLSFATPPSLEELGALLLSAHAPA